MIYLLRDMFARILRAFFRDIFKTVFCSPGLFAAPFDVMSILCEFSVFRAVHENR